MAPEVTAKMSPEGRRGIMHVFVGNVFAQALPLAAAPFVTRAVTPSEMGQWATFFGITLVVAVLATLRYSHAIVLPKDDAEGVALWRLSTGLTVVVGSVVVVLGFVMKPIVAEFPLFIEARPLAPLLPLIGLSVCLEGSIHAAYNLHNRLGSYRQMALGRAVQFGVMGVGPLLTVRFLPGVEALVAAQIAGEVLGLLVLSIPAGSASGVTRWDRTVSWRLVALRYRRFPQFSMPADLVSMAASEAPTILLLTLAGADASGQFSLANRALAAPVYFIAVAVGTVFRREAAVRRAEGMDLRPLYKETAGRLALLGAPMALGVGLFSIPLFPFVFGAGWGQAGVFAAILAPLLGLRFIAGPLSSMLHIAEKQEWDLAWQIVLFAVTSSALVIGVRVSGANMALVLFSLGYGLMYLVNLKLTYGLATPPTSSGPEG